MPSETYPPEHRKSRDFVASLERGLRILSAFGRDNPEMTLSEIAQRTKLSPATARRLLLTLRSLGYVNISGRLFSLRPKVLELGYGFLTSMAFEDLFQPYLQEIVQSTGDSSSIVVLDRHDILYLANASVRRLVRLSATVGSRFPAYPTSTGRVLLAHCTPEFLKDYFKTERFVKITEFTEINVDRLKEIIESVRTVGHAVVQDELEVGLVAVAVPLRDANGNVIAAMNCSSVARRTDSDEIVRTRLDLLKGYAEKVSSALSRVPALAHSLRNTYGETAIPAEHSKAKTDRGPKAHSKSGLSPRSGDRGSYAAHPRTGD